MKKFKKSVEKRNIDIMSIGHKIHDYDNDIHIGCFDCNECHCCKNNIGIDVSHYEVKLLKRLVQPKHKENAKTALNTKSLRGRYDCPFLLEGRCSIYAHRPIACSTYMVATNDPSDCIDDDLVIGSISRIDILKHLDKGLIKFDNSTEYDLLDVFR